ncbi:MAG: OsmC family peroxiredoxin [Desulfobacterales bacterium]|nr:OsmC family peroxiredoxin [Desulfobacterales bacterium]
MSEYRATIIWHRQSDEDFIQSKYSRGHEWAFDGGTRIPASSSPSVVPVPYSVEANVDPEEAFVAALSSCHMLLYLSIAAKRRFVIDTYTDNAIGTMEQDENGRHSITKVVLRPEVTYSGDKQPSVEQVKKMHDLSHEQCFIANSVKTEVITEMLE